MKLKNRRMLSFLMAIVMVLTMLPSHPLEVKAAPTPTLNLGTPAGLSQTTYQLSNATFNSTGVVHASGGYFTVTVNNGSIAVGALSSGITELTSGITISGIVTDKSTPTNRVFNFSSTNTYEQIQDVIRNMTFTQVSGLTQRVTVKVTAGAPLTNGKTSVRSYNGRYFVYVERPSTMTFKDAVTVATNLSGHLVEPAPAHPEEMLAIANLFKEFKTAFGGKPGWNFISFIGATKTYTPDWNTSVGNFTRYVSTGFQTGLEQTNNYEDNGAYDHLTLLLDDNNTAIKYLGVNNTHGGSSAYKDPGVIVEFNTGVISNIITATKDVASFSKAPGGVGGASLWLKADKDATANGQDQLTGWTDQTGTNQFAVNGSPTYKADAANFNPAVLFNNTTQPSQNPNQYLIGDTPITYQDGYAVFKLKDGTIIGSAAPRPGGYGAAIFSKWGDLYVGNGATGTYRGFPFNDSSRYYVGAFDATVPIQNKGRLNGTPQTVTGNDSFSQIDFTPVIGGTFGGGNTNNWSHLKGELAEVILYPASHTDLEKQQIESYLALKYGLTLNGGNTDYIASNGSTKMWTSVTNAVYGKRITGIGRDDGSDLYQKQSKSQEQGALVTISVGDAVYASNAANPNTINVDLSFFVFSDNGATAKYETEIDEVPGHHLKRLNRVFKVEKSANWADQAITLKLDTATENPAVLYYLVIDGVTTNIKLDAAGKATINSSLLANGSTFTYAKVYKNDLKAKLSGIEGLTEGNYANGWDALVTARTAAENVLNNPNATQEEVDGALSDLEDALAGLVSDNAKLEAKVDAIKLEIDPGDLDEGDYTVDSWNALTQALNDAEALLNQPTTPTQAQLGQALSALERARGGLVDLSGLRAKKTQIEAEHLQPTNYTANSWQVLQQALTEAQAVLDDEDATQAEVDEAKSALEAARAALVDKSVLQTRKNAISGENLQQSVYTPGSWEVLQRALVQAESVLGDPNATQTDVNEARDQLIAARNGLVPINNNGNNNGNNGGNGGGPSGPSPSKQTITVDVLIGGENPADVTKVDIERTTHGDGRITDQVTFTPEKALETAEKAKKTGKNLARIVFPDPKDEVSEVKVDVPRQAFATLLENKIDLEIYTDNAVILIPHTSLAGLEKDFYFRLVPIRDPDERADVEQRARTEQIVRDMAQNDQIKVVARPMTIETNLSSREVTLTLPLKGVKLPQDEQERQAYLNELVIFIEHTDGDKDLVAGEAVKQANGEFGLRFSIDKFSTFTILHMEGKKEAADRHVHYINGYKDGSFKPNQGATRAELAAMLVNLGAAKSPATGAKFPDVPASHWAATAVSQVTAAGIMKGYPDGRFQPNRKVTRAEMAAILYQYLKLNEGTASGKFSDVSAKHWANGMISAVVEAGLMSGYSDNTFRPVKELTRAEAVTILNRIFDRGPLYGTGSSWSDVPESHWAYLDIEEASRDHAYRAREQGGEQWVAE